MSVTSVLVRGLRKGEWQWNDKKNGLEFISSVKKIKKKGGGKEPFRAFNGLTAATMRSRLTFRDSVSTEELFNFHKSCTKDERYVGSYYVTMEDLKTVSLFLCKERLPRIFTRFFALQIVNQLLRGCILYIQYFLQTVEYVYKTRHLLCVKYPDKLTTYESKSRDLDDLRVLLGRFYAGIIFKELGRGHATKTSTDEILIFEYFLQISTHVVWVALQRRYFSIVKFEMGRIFRSAYFNSKEEGSILDDISHEKMKVINGETSTGQRRLRKTPKRSTITPIIQNFIKMEHPQLIMIGRKDFHDLKEKRLKFLTDYMFGPEERLFHEGIQVGILGTFKRLYDPLFYPVRKLTLHNLVTGSPMNVTEDRRGLRLAAQKILSTHGDPVSPHIFDKLDDIPRPNTFEEEEEEKAVDEDQLMEIVIEGFEEEEIYELQE